ncbi:unnamed protein product [Durusdinium trenchii]|uniref:Uncharacterized protein n=2 Tax=Durusdinium trenchii TaxID=1381693 RepID=A0ABP0HIX3_9DINO
MPKSVALPWRWQPPQRPSPLCALHCHDQQCLRTLNRHLSTRHLQGNTWLMKRSFCVKAPFRSRPRSSYSSPKSSWSQRRRRRSFLGTAPCWRRTFVLWGHTSGRWTRRHFMDSAMPSISSNLSLMPLHSSTTSGRALPGSDAELVFGEPTGLQFENPPQACSLTFNDKGQVTKFTIGYVMDRMVGNTGGMGGFFGVLWRIGKGFPFSEGQPYAPSTGYWLFAQVNRLFAQLRILLAKDEAEKRRLKEAMIDVPAGNLEVS